LEETVDLSSDRLLMMFYCRDEKTTIRSDVRSLCIVGSFINFYARSHRREMRHLASSCLHVSPRMPLVGFP
jgi:hypothetical protein